MLMNNTTFNQSSQLNVRLVSHSVNKQFNLAILGFKIGLEENPSNFSL